MRFTMFSLHETRFAHANAVFTCSGSSHRDRFFDDLGIEIGGALVFFIGIEGKNHMNIAVACMTESDKQARKMFRSGHV